MQEDDGSIVERVDLPRKEEDGGWREKGDKVTVVERGACLRLARDGEYEGSRKATVVRSNLLKRKHRFKGKNLRMKNGLFDRCKKADDVTLQKIFHVLDRNKDNWVDLNELMHFFSLWTDSAKDGLRISGPKGDSSYRPNHHPSTWKSDATKHPVQRRNKHLTMLDRVAANAGSGGLP